MRILVLEKVLSQRQSQIVVVGDENHIQRLMQVLCMDLLLQGLKAVKDNGYSCAVWCGRTAIADTAVPSFACGYMQMLTRPPK